MRKPIEAEKMKDAKKYKADQLHDLPDWLQEFREHLVEESSPLEPQRNPVSRHFQFFLMNYQWSREQVEPGSGKHSVHTHFPKDPNCDICLKTKITRTSCRRRAGTVVPTVANVGDLITADHKILSEGIESRNIQSSICRGGTRLGNSVVTI